MWIRRYIRVTYYNNNNYYYNYNDNIINFFVCLCTGRQKRQIQHNLQQRGAAASPIPATRESRPSRRQFKQEERDARRDTKGGGVTVQNTLHTRQRTTVDENGKGAGRGGGL